MKLEKTIIGRKYRVNVPGIGLTTATVKGVTVRPKARPDASRRQPALIRVQLTDGTEYDIGAHQVKSFVVGHTTELSDRAAWFLEALEVALHRYDASFRDAVLARLCVSEEEAWGIIKKGLAD